MWSDTAIKISSSVYQIRCSLFDAAGWDCVLHSRNSRRSSWTCSVYAGRTFVIGRFSSRGNCRSWWSLGPVALLLPSCRSVLYWVRTVGDLLVELSSSITGNSMDPASTSCISNIASSYNQNNNNLIYKPPYGCNHRGAWAQQAGLAACKRKCLIKRVSFFSYTFKRRQ